MRKLIFGTILLLLPIICFGQLVKTSVSYAQAAAEAPSYETEYQALLDAWGTDPTGDYLTYQNVLVDSLTTYPIGDPFWDRFDVLIIAAANNEDNAKFNWPTATSIITDPGTTAPTFTAWEGWTGVGNADYLSTNYNPTTDATNYARNSASLGMWFLTNIQEGGTEHGANATHLMYITSRETYNSVFFLINTSNGITVGSITDGSGLWVNTRRASDDIEGYHNGSSVSTGSAASSGVPNGDFYLLWDGAGADYSNNQVAIYFIMDALSDDEEAQLYRFFSTYLTSIGAI